VHERGAITVMTQNVETSSFERIAAHSAAVRAYLDNHRGELRALLATPGCAGLTLARRHAEIVDGMMCKLYVSASFGRSGSAPLMGAVGGYGRRLLGLRSDLDVCFVTTGSSEALLPLVKAMLYPLWDAGLSVGHHIIGVSEVAQAAQEDLPTATGLLDFRPLAGDAALMPVLRQTLSASVFHERELGAFIGRLEAHAAARHEHFGDSVYLLEPDVKNGTGGLRDLDFALWAARARFGTSDLAALASAAVITEQRLRELQRALDFLWTVRNHLHNLARRRSDRLTFAEQETIARLLGYGRASGVPADAPEIERTGAMVEAFMSEYYRHARVIAQTRDQIIGHAKRRQSGAPPPARSIGNGMITCEGRIGLADPSQLKAEPVLALRLYAAALARHIPVLARTRDAIAGAAADAPFCARLRESREAAQLFVKLASSCRAAPFSTNADSILSELHEVGLLLALIPEFGPVVGRVHHDLYHVYTVDVHSVAAVDRLRALCRGDLAAQYPLACRLAAEITRPRVLFLAALLHDVGKAIGGHDHARRGAEMARAILTRLGLASDEVEDACYLVLKHLAMYTVAARRDLSDEAAVAEFAREVRGREGLRDLYLLTVADVSTTSPVSMTKWKASMLDALYRGSDALLSGQTRGEPSRVPRVRAQVRSLWPQGRDLRGLDEYLETMPERYLLSNTPEEIAAHALLAMRPGKAPVAAALLPSSHGDMLELCVVTENKTSTGLCVVAGDRPGLLAAISAAIAGSRLEIQAAQVNSRPLPGGGFQAVDLFWVHGDSGGGGSLQEQLSKLERDLNAVIAGEVAPHELLPRSSRSRWSVKPLPPVSTQIVFDHRGSTRHTIIEVVTQDRPALLFTLAQALHALGITIAIAKITTEGTRVIDVFYVTEADGSKLDPGARSAQAREQLLLALSALD
jgi:[protein-PII] uridylyltransferase